MYAFKGFDPGLICLGYQFVMGKNVTEEANCCQNGFHCAENPLDCLSYYGDIHHSVYCLVIPEGDIDEDQVDSKISCTELNIVKQLTLRDFFLHALAYMVDHPNRPWNSRVQKSRGTASNGYCVVRGADPIACGKKGDILAFAQEDPATGEITQVALTTVTGENIKPDIWYDINLQPRKVKNRDKEKATRPASTARHQ